MKIRPISYFLFVVLLVIFEPAHADTNQAAKRLLRVTDIGRKFESMALQQTRDIIRTYASIVSMSVQVALPAQIKQDIAACYAEVYAWKNFAPGIAQILAENLSQKELQLLIDFYGNRSLPPMEIQTFKDILAKAGQIQQISADYIFAHSTSCVERDADLIRSYLANRERQLDPHPVVE
ncbi:MAG: hypothetical protein IIC60_10670 [Proteobacteria bacterium]|nr:hypothetical protein [Pseudomonadota bacterium]